VAEPAVLINVFEVPAAEAERFIVAWEKARDYLQDQPGYIATTLHQALAPDAEWASAADFLAAIGSPGFRESAAGLAGYRAHPGLYGSPARSVAAR
jgi:heme-degrading monooxygenase HmoA